MLKPGPSKSGSPAPPGASPTQASNGQTSTPPASPPQPAEPAARPRRAAVVWNGDLPRPLQQVLFDAADGITPPVPARTGEHELAAIGL